MRENHDRLVQLLEEKKEKFLAYEAQTLRLESATVDSVDGVTEAIEERERIRGMINDLDNRIREYCGETPEGRHLYEVTKNRCDVADLLPEQQRAYQEGQEIFQVIARIQSEEELVRTHLERISMELQGRMKQNHREVKFAGYLKNMSAGGVGQGYLYNKKR